MEGKRGEDWTGKDRTGQVAVHGKDEKRKFLGTRS